MEQLFNNSFSALVFYSLFFAFVSIAVTLFFIFILKKKFLGSFWMGLLVAIIGSLLGSILLSDIFKALTEKPYGINTLAILSGAFFLLWIYSVISKQDEN